jgi:pimeloyl-ACP methyl ester carboxylesterase
MRMQVKIEKSERTAAGDDARAHLLAEMPVTERRLDLAGVSTAVLEGGDGAPVVLLHGPGDLAATWMRVLPDLVAAYRVVAPDLPGHGDSEVARAALTTDGVLAWLGELIEHTCSSAPALVGHALGGAIAARFAAGRRGEISRLVLVDPLGLSRFRPAPRFAVALLRFLVRPSARTQDRLIRQCVVDLDGMREQVGEPWERYAAYRLERARTPGQRAALRSLMAHFGVPAIPSSELARIAVPTTLIQGRHDRITRLRAARDASRRYGWPLHLIEHAGADPALEQPEAFVGTLRAALASPGEEDLT